MIITQHEKRSGAMCLEAVDRFGNTLAHISLNDIEYERFVDYAAAVGTETAFWDFKAEELEAA
ncbi:hypothetical protein C7446_2533 [Kushneria sinocarnis]|uniref:Uncharacterized protein n=1 Tax=Kushneria sinocarnis TaxID=595502 RepID=A0A420WUK6_9GAMM|nr:hypothetical protein [Kushneria sinocarnis]RKQ97114.1 hypothetical protein C7446_2533 [Kushneria sinocarnis]